MAMLPIENLRSKLAGAEHKLRPAGEGKWSARCPAHDDRAASLGLGAFPDGAAWVKCHAGCDPAEILAKLGMTKADLQPERPGKRNGHAVAPATGKAWPTIDGATDAVRQSVAKKEGEAVEAGRWIYTDASGAEVAAVVRFDTPTPAGEKQKKTFRPLHRVAAGWAMGDPLGRWPLYRLPTLAGAKRVYVCEGEKAADAAASCGINSTTSAHGAEAAAKTDWTPLAASGAEVIFLPDHDAAGADYVSKAAAAIHAVNPAAVVKAVELADLAGDGFPKGGDFVEFARDFRGGQEADAIRAEIDAAAEKAAPLELAAPSPAPIPTPATTGGLADLTAVFGVEIKRVIKRGAVDGIFELIPATGDPVTLGTAADLYRFRTIQAAWLDARTGVGGETIADSERFTWSSRVAIINRAAEIVETMSEADETRSWLGGLIRGDYQQQKDVGNPESLFELLANGVDREFFESTDGRLFVRLAPLLDRIDRYRLGRIKGQRELALRLSRIGFSPIQLAARQGERTAKARYWVSPEGWET